MKVLVLGAGVAGVACAWYLRRDGHEVTVLERNPGVALEANYANGGHLSYSGAARETKVPLEGFRPGE